MLEFEVDKESEHDSKAANLFWMLAGKIKQKDWGNEQKWIKECASRREKTTCGGDLICGSIRGAISEVPLGLWTKGSLAEEHSSITLWLNKYNI